MAVTWPDIVAFGCSLPGAELSTSYGRPALKVRKKVFACTGKADDHFVLMVEVFEKEVLMQSEPAVFFETPHYVGWPAVLVRYATVDRARCEALVERAWSRRAAKAQLRARGGSAP